MSLRDLDRPAGDGVGDHPVAFHAAVEGPGLAVVDLVERQRYTVATDAPVAPTAADADDLLFPVDAAARVRAGELRFPGSPSLYVRDADGAMVANPTPGETVEVPAGEYHLEVTPPVKLYLRVAGPLTVTATVDDKRVALEGPSRVVVGARSLHERPAGTVTTTADPEDVMAAVSTFGSALKTTSPERSFPTLRGHPPALELGDELAIPDELAAPHNGVTVEVPPELRSVLPVASLAHYLGAEVVPGDAPRLVTDAGLEHDLAPGGALEREVERVLKHVFVLDCVARTEGLYGVDLHERRQVEAALEEAVDWAALYDQPLAERLETYLALPDDAVAPAVPDWKLAAYVQPEPSSLPALPYLVADLALVRVPPGADGATADDAAGPDRAPAAVQQAAVDDLLGGDAGRAGTVDRPELPVDEVDAMEVAWVGDGAPHGASKVTAAGYRHRLDREPVERDLGVTVVCNDPSMVDERTLVDGVYGGDVAVTRRERLTTGELAAVLADETAFLHYVGHVDAGGFRCTDGTLDARTLGSVGVESFLLNACDSYEQGMALVEGGAVGGVVTLRDVTDDSALLMGSTLARLLANGYPLRPALGIARHASYVGDDYVVVGDGTVSVVQAEEGGLDLFRVTLAGDTPVLEYRSYACLNAGMGVMSTPNVAGNERYYLEPGTLDTFEMDGVDELLEFLTRAEFPVLLDRELHWSAELDREKLVTALAR